MKTAHEILREKMDAEMSTFEQNYQNMTSTQVYNDWYIIGFKEEFYEMLSSDFIDNQGVEDELLWLAEMNTPIQYMYDYWMECDDGAFNHDWKFMLELVRNAYCETIQD